MRRRLGRFLVLAIAAGTFWWWFTHGKPSAQQMVDDVTRPLFGSKAAVQESERNRVSGEAVGVIADQTETSIETLRLGMKFSEVRELLGQPNVVETPPLEKGKPETVRWTYKSAHRFLVFEDGRLVSITIL